MDRGSDKHGSVHDEALKSESAGMTRAGHATRAEEWHEAEPSAEGQPEGDRDPQHTMVGGTPPGMSAGDVEGRAELARWLDSSAFPGDRDRLLESARTQNAPDAVLGRLADLPRGRTFTRVQDVWQALGGHVEEHRS